MSAEKIPLNEMLDAIDRRDFDWYSNLPEESKKQWSSWLTLRYASSVKGSGADEAILNTNEFANKYYKDIYKHDDLMWKLFCLTGTGKKQYHEWIKAPNNLQKKDKVSELVAQMYPTMKNSDIELMRSMNSEDEIRQHAMDFGYSDKELSEVFGKTKSKKK
jgi:hypothetical protein